jgi:hypothetical protein
LGGNNDAVDSLGWGENGSPYDFLGNLWNGSITGTYLGRSPSGIGLCGCWLENLGRKSGVNIEISNNVIDQCRGGGLASGVDILNGIGADQVLLPFSQKQLPDLNVLVQDIANNEIMLPVFGLEPRPTFEVRMLNNRIRTNSRVTGCYGGTPILLLGTSNSRIVGNVITGALIQKQGGFAVRDLNASTLSIAQNERCHS